jgi:hypothetical protein
MDVLYTVSANGGETSITCNMTSAPNGWIGCEVMEVHWSGSGEITLDGANSAYPPCGLSIPGLTIPMKGNTDLAIQMNWPFNTNTTGITPPWVTFQTSDDAYVLNATASLGTMIPTWTLPQPDPACALNAFAFEGH